MESLHPAEGQVPIISREIFDRLSRIHRAALLLMAQDGEVRIEPEMVGVNARIGTQTRGPTGAVRDDTGTAP